MKRGFDIIGDIAIVKFPEGTMAKKKKTEAAELMRKNKHITSVFEKYGKTEGEKRLPKIRWLLGSRKGITLHRENSCVFKVDVRRVFFTPRLGHERLRIVSLAGPNELVLDMFAGVGPYSIPLAKKVKEVHAVDINKYAVDLLKENASLNKVKNIKIAYGDARKVVPKIKTKFDRIIMNFPLDSISFLKVAKQAIKPKGTIHLYKFVNTRDEEDLKKTAQEIKDVLANTKVRITPVKAGEIAPNITRVCFDIKL